VESGREQEKRVKRITILRHAKSGWDDPVARDFDRGLNARGERAAVLIGEAAAQETLGIDGIISSPAVRCVQTLDQFQPAAGLAEMEPHWDRRVYLASSATLLDLLRETDGALSHILLCGHNPGLEDLILDTVPDSPASAHRDSVEEKFPTASLATLAFAIEDWHALCTSPATIERFIRPRDLDPALGPED
jgi:phosphohistidine phosphatase